MCSGTTGLPKAVTVSLPTYCHLIIQLRNFLQVTHDIFLNNSLAQGERLKLTHEDVVSKWKRWQVD